MVLPDYDVRYIAINDNVDTLRSENEMMVFKNVFNDWYARDYSKKIKAVFKAKGQSGKPLGKPPYGYKKSETDKNVWNVDDETAEVVRRVFQMCIDGYGPTQIARILTEEKVLTPTAYTEGSVIGGVAGAAADIENCYSFSTIDCSLPDEKDENGFVIEGEKKKDTNLKGNIIGEKSESDKLIDTYYIDGNERTERESVGAVGNDEAFNILKRGNTDEEIMSAEFAELLGENFCKVDNYCPFVKGYRFIDEIENAGDANEDGCVDIFDVNAVKNYLINDDCSLNPLGKSLADVDNQKGITISDAVRIKEYIVGLNTKMWHDGSYKGAYSSSSGSHNTNTAIENTITEIETEEENKSIVVVNPNGSITTGTFP